MNLFAQRFRPKASSADPPSLGHDELFNFGRSILPCRSIMKQSFKGKEIIGYFHVSRVDSKHVILVTDFGKDIYFISSLLFLQTVPTSVPSFPMSFRGTLSAPQRVRFFKAKNIPDRHGDRWFVRD